MSYERDGENVTGYGGRVDYEFENGMKVGIDAVGRWAQRYGPVGGGLSEMQIKTDDGRVGTRDLRMHRRVPPPLLPGAPPRLPPG